MIQERIPRKLNFIKPEIVPVLTQKYRAIDDEGLAVWHTVQTFRSVHVATDRYEPIASKWKGRKPLQMFKYYRVRDALGRAVASDFPDREGIATFIAYCVARYYWDVVMKHLIVDHDIVSCLDNTFVLKVAAKKIKDPAYITIKNGGILNSVGMELTAKGLKVTRNNRYSFHLARKYIKQIEEEIDNGRYYG